MKDQGQRSELQERIAAELREKMARQGSDDGENKSKLVEELPDHVEDSAYAQSYKKSKPIPRQVWILIVSVVAVAVCGVVIALAK